MQPDQIGETHAAMDFGCGLGNRASHFAQMRLELTGHQTGFEGNLVERMPGIPDKGPRRLEVGRHLRAHVLDRLEGADHAAELHPLTGIGDRLIDHVLGGTQ